MKSNFNDAVNHFQNGQINKAKEICFEILKIEPNNFNVLHLLGVIAFQIKNYSKSVEIITKAIEVNPNNSEVYNFRGIALIHLKKLEEAVQNWNKAIQIDPNYADAYNNRGNALIKLGKINLSLKDFEKAIKIKPNYAEAHNNLGNVLKEIKKLNHSLNSYNEAIKINPNYAEAYSNRSIVLKDLNRLDSALESSNKAIEINPRYSEAYNSKGIILRKLNQFKEALKNYDKAIELNPNFANAYINRGNILLNETKQIDLALESYTKALKINSKLDFLFGTYIHIKFWLSNWNLIDEEINSLKNKIINGERTATPFSILSLLDLPDLQIKNAKKFVEKQFSLTNNLGPILKKAPNKKIRIGYYSADFHNHAMSFLLAHLFEVHDRSKFEIIGFSLEKRKNDEMRKRVSKAFDKFIDVSLKSDQEIAKISREFNVDIAIDLMGFTRGNKFQIFAEKCAPIQASYLGYPGTTGSNFIDYIIADKILIPKELQKHYSEKIIYLPDTYQVNDSTKKISDKVFTREELGLPKDGFVFCCYNKNYKILPKVFDIWMRLLKKVNGSVLWLLVEDSIIEENLKKEAIKRNIDENRIIFAKRMPLAEHLARQKTADLFIDTFPYTAHTTCSDSLWAGLPVLTRIGESFASRVSASLLTAIGLPELITHTEKEYEDLAIELANNRNKLEEIKSKLEKNKFTKPLFNTKLFANNIESAYKKMYERYLKVLPVENIEI